MTKTKVMPYPATVADKEYSHLEPVVEMLIQAGNATTRPGGFYLDRDGWHCDLQKPIDFELLRSKFEFPTTIILSEPLDKIFCKNSWVEIKGGVSRA